MIFRVLMVLLILSVGGILLTLNSQMSVLVPTSGGTFTEGIIGTPRFINPVLAVTDADRDLTQLVYSGLVRRHGFDSIEPDLAKSYTVSENDLVYTFVLRDDITFHDGEPVTADDILFTINKVQDGLVKSPQKVSWDGITAEKLNDTTITFTLKKPYAGFLEQASIGILPEHVWGQITSDQFAFSDFNNKPIGSGPYTITNVKRTKSGIPTQYELRAFSDFTLGEPYIRKVTIKIFPDEATLVKKFNRGNLDAVGGLSPEYMKTIDERNVLRTSLPRVFGVFFNQSESSIIKDSSVREAIHLAIDRDGLVNTVLGGYGTPLFGPLPPNMPGYTPQDVDTENSLTDRREQARELLDEAGWILEEGETIRTKEGEKLSFNLKTSNIDELKLTAERIKQHLDSVGIEMNIQVFEPGTLDQDIIRTRDYEALLFGQILRHDSDLFAFWHSSQRNDPGLNIANYTNPRVDSLLEEALQTSRPEERGETNSEIINSITDDHAAVFLYAPDFVYNTRKVVHELSLNDMTQVSDRYINIASWYLYTDSVWNIFTKNNTNK